MSPTPSSTPPPDRPEAPGTRVVRPRARRYTFVASIELTDVHSEEQVQQQTSDLSLFGCHVVPGRVLSPGARIRIRIRHEGTNFHALGKVVYFHRESGIGVEFTQIERNDQEILEHWVGKLRGKTQAAG